MTATIDVDAPTINIAALDDHPVVLDGIAVGLSRLRPDIQLRFVAQSIDELLAHDLADIDVVLLDLEIPGPTTAADHVAAILARGPRVLIFTAENERAVLIQRAIAAGASGLALKADPMPDLAAAVTAVSEGDLAFSGAVAQALLADSTILTLLTDRRIEVIQEVATGLPYKSIARRLGVTEATIREHVKRAVAAYQRRGVEVGNAHGLVRQARKDGFIDD
ncbi:MAG: response regulator transcription factor [Aeromicrobium sp.]|uniref:LuxR C-terminal-related transcriptional regulator n=1 Tax=Aeromicrobium sp. TaxID=1871063 RepID=UPI0039E477DB